MIGQIMRQRREEMGMTRQKLAESICSEKYIYMIENNQRTPSVEIVNKFNKKLKINLFEYYDVLKCNDPVGVKYFSDRFTYYRRRGDIKSLMEISYEAKSCSDFNREPLCHEITVIELEFKFYENGNYNQIIHDIQKSYFSNNKVNVMDITLSRVYKIMSMCYLKLSDVENANNYYHKGYEIIEGNEEIEKYRESIHSYMMYKLSILYHEKSYNNIISHSKKTLRYQERMSDYDRIYYVYYYAAFAYYELEKFEKSRMLFIRASYAIILYNSLFDYEQIKQYSHFYKIMDALEIPETLKIELKNFDDRRKL